MTSIFMRQLKKQMGYSNQEIADKSGVPYSTVQKLLSGTTASPRHETLAALDHFFSTALPAYRTVQTLRSKDASMISDSTAPYYSNSDKKQGQYTLEDYLSLPNDQRVELMCLRHALRGVRDQIARHQGILHSLVSHRNAVAYRNRGKDSGDAAGHGNSHLHGVNDFIDVHMTGNNLIIRADDSDQRLFQLFLCESKCIEQ